MAVLDQLFELLPDALLVVDAEGRIVSANGRAEEMFGYDRGDLLGVNVDVLMPASLRARHRRHRREYMAHPRVRPMGTDGLSLVGQRRGGEQFPLEISLGPLRGPDGMQYLASIRDISESQRVRQALVRARYDALVARIGQAALASTDDAQIMQQLPAELAAALQVDAVAIVLLAGHTLQVAAQHGFAEGKAADLLDPARGGGPIARALSSSQAVVIEAGGAHSSAVMPVTERDRSIGAIVVLASDGQRFDHDAMHLLQLVAALLSSLMLRRRTEEQLAHAQRLEAIGQLTGGVAHDFNNMLTVMSGNLQLLEALPDLPAAGRDLIASALRSVSRAAELTAKLLAFARRQRLRPRPVDPVHALSELVAMLERTLGDAIRLCIACPASLPAAYVDPAQLDTALVNLALNARDAMPAGGRIVFSARERTVTHRRADNALEPGHYVVFSVADTGCGMTADTVARAVEPFFTTKSGGNGLGLSMVYGFVTQSGGSMNVQSRLGEGTEVSLYLPATARAVAADPEPAPAPAMQGDTRVLVVEDEADVRAIAEAFLRSLGYAVHGARDAREALEILQAEPRLSLLFSDVQLGAGMDGHALAFAARALRPGLPVVLASGYDRNGAGSALPDAGMPMLRKPYRREDLAQALTAALRSRPREH